MDYLDEYGALGKAELAAVHTQLRELLAEVTEERELILGQSGHHIASTKLFNRYRRELEDIQARIAAVEGLLHRA